MNKTEIRNKVEIIKQSHEMIKELQDEIIIKKQELLRLQGECRQTGIEIEKEIADHFGLDWNDLMYSNKYKCNESPTGICMVNYDKEKNKMSPCLFCDQEREIEL